MSGAVCRLCTVTASVVGGCLVFPLPCPLNGRFSPIPPSTTKGEESLTWWMLWREELGLVSRRQGSAVRAFAEESANGGWQDLGMGEEKGLRVCDD